MVEWFIVVRSESPVRVQAEDVGASVLCLVVGFLSWAIHHMPDSIMPLHCGSDAFPNSCGSIIIA